MPTRSVTSPAVATVSPHRRIVIATVIAAGIQIGVVWLPMLPLGVADEWVWSRVTYGVAETALLFLNALPVIPIACAYIFVCRRGDGRVFRVQRLERTGWLAVLVAAGFAWLYLVQDAAPNDYDRLGRDPIVLYYPGVSGYFTQARNAEDFGKYLANYEDLMAEGDVLHLGTHPPGLIALHRLLLDLYDRSPALVEATLASRPQSVRATQEIIAAVPLSDGGSLTPAEFAELWGASLLMQLAAVAAVVPLFLCIERTAGTTAAWRAACLWPLVPALTIFLPKADTLYPLIGMSVLAFWYQPGRSPGVLRAALAGATFWFGMTLSLAMLPVGVLAAFLSMQHIGTADPADRRRIITAIIRDTAVVVLSFVCLSVLTGYFAQVNLWNVWGWNVRNHAAFYETFTRTYWKWLVINPLELAMAVGMPVAVCVVAAIQRSRIDLRSVALPIIVVIVMLWLSGKNSGEAARLWLFLMPWLLWIASDLWRHPSDAGRWRAVLSLQMLICFLTAVRISGFGFEQLLNAAG